MSKTGLQTSVRVKSSKSTNGAIVASARRHRVRKNPNNSDVLVSAVLSTYLLTHLHQVLQRAEFGAAQEGRTSQAANFAQLRKLLCMDARSMKDASAVGLRDRDMNN